MYLLCVDVWNRLESENHCCGSCHDEFDDGYHTPLEMYIDGSLAYGCCAAWDAVVKVARSGRPIRR